jgi:hypothetical protein
VNGSIHAASEAAHKAIDESRRDRLEAERRIRTLRAIDRVLESLEEVNLSGRGFEPVTGVSYLALERATASELPPPVRGALTPVDLHEALLDWQEQLLDRVVPARATYHAVDAEIDPPEQRRRRRRRRSPAALRSAA